RRKAIVNLQQVGLECSEFFIGEPRRITVLAIWVLGGQRVPQGGRGAVVQVGSGLPDAEQGRRVDARELATEAKAREFGHRANVVEQPLCAVGEVVAGVA